MGLWDRVSRRLGELSEEFLPADLRDRVEAARERIERGQPAEGAAALEEVLRVKPDHATALYLLGMARLREGDATAAASAFERAIAARAGFAEALAGLGETRLLAGDPNAALSAFREALDQAGGDQAVLGDAHRGLGLAYLRAGNRDKAVRELRKALAEDPADGDAATALAEALLADPTADPDEARAPLARAAARENAPVATRVALGRLDARAGRHAEAEDLLGRALGEPLPPALRVEAVAALAGCARARNDLPLARRRLEQALELAPDRADLHDAHAEVLRALDYPGEALAAYDRAYDLAGGAAGRLAAWRLALETALAAGDMERASRWAERILADHPADPLALAARAALLVDPAAARAGLQQALAAGETIEAHLALGRLELEAGAPARAVEHARAALRVAPADARARAFLSDARAAELGGSTPVTDLYTLASRVHGATLAARELADLAPAAARTLDSVDRPLLVTVMGEFSSGKSTFVNAFLGAEVAPIGATPTTATINILKYGATPAGRIVYLDDTVRDLHWDDVGRTLRALEPAETRRIRQVEILYPADTLQRVNLVDTPGLNSILPEHEATARAFIAEADAVIWLFAAGQAGKATEREALAKIREEGRRVLGVVNKIDQASPEDAQRILAHLAGELGDLVETLVPVAARRALAARQARDEAALAASAWPGLEAVLEERYFREARRIKRDACTRRLGGLLAEGRARARAAAEAARDQATRLERAAAAARADVECFGRVLVFEERRRLAEGLATTYRAAAREVLDLVRPRKLPFGTHSATAADRDYLLGLLDRGLADLLEPTRQRVHAELRRAGRDARAAAVTAADGDELAREVDAAVERIDAAVFATFRAFLRGWLRGGRIDEFFARTLPRLELSEDAVYHALVRDAPDLDSSLLEPLLAHGQESLRRLAARLEHQTSAADAARHDAEHALGAALDALDADRRRLETT